MVDPIQPMSVAGIFYPAARDACAGLVDGCLARARDAGVAPKAVIAPHAGYAYSGAIAGSAYAPLLRRRGEIRRIVLLGPCHRVPVRGMRCSPAEAWAVPGGELEVDRAGRAAIADLAPADPAPFVGEHSLEVQLPFLRGAFGPAISIVPVLVGDAEERTVAELLRRLWGGPETAIVISSDLSHYHDADTARAKDGAAARAIETLSGETLDDDHACGRRAIRGLLAEARARDLRATCLDLRNSGDTAGPKDRVVGYGAFAFEPAATARLADATREFLLTVARRAIAAGIEHPGTAPPALRFTGRLPPGAGAMRAAFVTLTLDGALRGCIGSILAQRPLAEDVWINAWKAAFADPRFARLTAEEAARIEVHVALLSTPRRIRASGEDELVGRLAPDADGLIVRDAGRQSIFLPSVWRAIPDARDFVRRLKRKAGLAEDHWSAGFEAYRFSTESFGEDRPRAA